ncbi:MAG: glycosyltransferase [Fibromonadaceae bacterium]|jgi:glycosyltransferase involved in cell wall biosynthesis|nr:glycosyltransferase [Fibromonadaceae bacterium]
MQKLISVITPTYNNGHLIHRLLDSILQQTYNNIEMFVIDDGSTDNTKQIIEGYFEKFKEKGYSFHYMYQNNQGQSAAINNGLKLVNGDYLIWPDADDWYAEPNSIEILAMTLNNTAGDVSCVRCLSFSISEKTFNISHKTVYNEKQYLFEDCLLNQKKFFWGAGNYMIKTHIFFNEIEERTIYSEKEAGQNWQILLPILYNHKCITIDKYLYNILDHSNSHSRKKLSYEKEMSKYKTYFNTVINTVNNIKSMSTKEKKLFTYKVKSKFSILFFMTSFSFGKTENMRNIYKQMVAENLSIPKKTKFLYGLSFVPFGFTVHKILRISKKSLKKIL